MRDELLRLRTEGLAIMSAGTDTYVVPPEWQGRADRWAADMEALASRLEAEVAELRLTLAAERGDQAGALPGWSWEDGEWKKRGGGLSAVVDRCAEAGLRLGWSWYIFRLDDESLAIRHAANTTAREAMRAADAAFAALASSDSTPPSSGEGGDR